MVNTTTTESKNSEKRDFFRISQDLIFDYKVVDSFTAENELPETEFEDSISANLLGSLRKLDRESIQTLQVIADKDRFLGDYLKLLNKKIDLIAKQVLFAQDSINKDQARTRVNLSEDGLAFVAERALYRDSFLALRLVFLPSCVTVLLFGQVIRCDAKENKYQVAVRFHRLTDKDRQIISRQILAAQVKEKKKKNTPK